MMEEIPEEHEMEEMRYPEYDEMDTEDLEEDLKSLNNPRYDTWNERERQSRIDYIWDILNRRIDEKYNKVLADTSFTDNEMGETKAYPEYDNKDIDELEERLKFLESPMAAFTMKETERLDQIAYIKRILESPTSWIDRGVNYEKSDFWTVKTKAKNEILGRINDYLSTGNFEVKKDGPLTVKVVRSYLSLTEYEGKVRPLLNNEAGHEIMRNTTFARGGDATNLEMALKFKGTEVRVANLSKNKTSKTNSDTENGKEFDKLVRDLFDNTNTIAENIADQTNTSVNTVLDNINNIEPNESLTTEQVSELVRSGIGTDEVVSIINKKGTHQESTEEQVKLQSKHTRDQLKSYDSSRIGKRSNKELRKDIEEYLKSDGPDKVQVDLPIVPDRSPEEIENDASANINNRLHKRARSIEGLTISNQELREFTGILNPAGDADVRIEALDITGDEYRLKALNEVDERKEQLYKNISEAAYLKSDLIYLVEKGELPKHSEGNTILNETIENNETVQDLSRFQRFKEWAKENLVGLSAVAIAVAGIITTVVVSARGAIVKGAQATSNFAKALYNLGKKFGALLAPLFSIVSAAVSLAAKGLAWLASNLWVLAIAFAWFIYDQYKERRKKT